MKLFYKILLTFLFIVFLFQFSAIEVYPGWFKHYGGIYADRAYSIQQNSDGSYIVAGQTNTYTHGGSDGAIYKLNSSGNKIWFKHYGGSQNEVFSSIQQTSDGGYIVSGYTTSFTYGNSDIAIYRLNSLGNKVWFKHYGGSSVENGTSIQQTSDGGYVVAGDTHSYTYGNGDFAIYKLDSSGNKIWFKHYGGAGDDKGRSIQQTSDGGYIVAGYTLSYTNGGYDFAIYKLDSNGNKVWFKHYGGANSDTSKTIQQTSDGGYIVAGQTKSYTNGGYDFAIYKLNSNGNKVWFKHYGGTSDDWVNSIQQTSDGGYVVSGNTESYTYGLEDFGIYKLNSSGNKIWFKHYGGTNEDVANSIQQTSDGGYIVSGNTESYTYGMNDIALYKLNSNGDK